MAPADSSGSSVSSRLRSGDLLHAGLALALLLGVWSVGGLEVSTGKVSQLEAINGSTVLLPCTYASCIGIKNLYSNWTKNGTTLCELKIAMEGMQPKVDVYHERVEFAGSSKGNNISILLWNITFEDAGDYICFAKNPKEKNRNHSATYTLIVLDQMREVDNTLTVIIVSVLGGVIGLVILIMVIKALVVRFLCKGDEKNHAKRPKMLLAFGLSQYIPMDPNRVKFEATTLSHGNAQRTDSKECLVSSGNDNTENGLSGAKGEKQGTPKA